MDSIFLKDIPYGQMAAQAISDKQWRDWCFSPPIFYDEVEAYRPDGLCGWDQPKVIKLHSDPALNVAGLWRRPVQR